MNDKPRDRELDDAVKAILSEPAGAARYRRYQEEMRNGRARDGDGARPREFDARGFPLPQRVPSFADRLARLLNPGRT